MATKTLTKAQKRFRKSMIREVGRLQHSKGITEKEFTEAYNDMVLFFCGHLLDSTRLGKTAISGTNNKGDTLIVTVTKRDLRKGN